MWKNLINCNPFHVGQKKLGELWSKNKKSSRGAYWPTQVDILRETTFRPLGVLPPQIFIHARDWARLNSAHHNGDGVPQKIICKNLKFGQKSSVCAPITSRLVGVPSQNFSRPRGARGVITWVPFLEGQPLKFGRAKKRPNFGAISDNFRLWSRISPEWMYTSNTWKKLDQPQPLPRWIKEIGWTLVHKQKSSRGAYWVTQVDIFRETTFRPLGGAAPSNFL